MFWECFSFIIMFYYRMWYYRLFLCKLKIFFSFSALLVSYCHLLIWIDLLKESSTTKARARLSGSCSLFLPFITWKCKLHSFNKAPGVTSGCFYSGFDIYEYDRSFHVFNSIAQFFLCLKKWPLVPVRNQWYLQSWDVLISLWKTNVLVTNP